VANKPSTQPNWLEDEFQHNLEKLLITHLGLPASFLLQITTKAGKGCEPDNLITPYRWCQKLSNNWNKLAWSPFA